MAPGLTSSDQAIGYQKSGWQSVLRRSTPTVRRGACTVSTVIPPAPLVFDRDHALAGPRVLGADLSQLLLDVAREHEVGLPLFVERNILRHRAVCFDPGQTEHRNLERVLHGVGDRGALEAAVDHAVGALLIVAD